MNVQAINDRCVLVEGEALASMRALLKDKSIDLICTDPPYGDHTHAMMGKERRNDGHKISEVLPFPPLTLDFIQDLAREFVRVGTGWINIFTDDRTIGAWGNALIAAGGEWVRTGYWVKTNPKPQMSADRPGTGAEAIVIGHVGGKMQWNGGGRAAVWRGNRDLDGLHPNQKPLWLMQELVGLFANEGATVLDPFAGSGTTGVACFTKERAGGLLPPDLECKACAKKHVEHLEKRPPIPLNYSFLGIEGHAPTFLGMRERLTKELAR